MTLFKYYASSIIGSIDNGIIHISSSPLALLGLALYIFSFLTWLFLIKQHQISSIQPILTGIVVVGSFLVGVLLFQESFNLFKIIGVVLIVIGTLLMMIQ
jgi:small multidrug resistance pump